ncbi:MAG: hypothetical protein ACI3WR_04750 [Oscillospiraceae bacterium]
MAAIAACAADPQQPASLYPGPNSGRIGQYADRADYAAETMAAAKTVTYYSQYGRQVTAPVLDTRLARLTVLAELEGAAREGTLELWEFNYYVKVLGSPALWGGQSEHDGWYDLKDPGGYLVAALCYEDGSCSVLSQQPFGDGTAFAGRSYEEILCDCYLWYKIEQYADNFALYDADGDGLLQTAEFPVFSGEALGLTGDDAALYDAAAETLRRQAAGRAGDTALLLPALTVCGGYEGERGERHYVCALTCQVYEELGTGAADAVIPGSVTYIAEITLGEGGGAEVRLLSEGGDDGRIRALCGPLMELAGALAAGEVPADARALTPVGTALLGQYLDYHFALYSA